MSASDKVQNKIQEVAGTLKKKIGAATGDEHLEARGRMDETKGNVKEAAEKVKDVFKD